MAVFRKWKNGILRWLRFPSETAESPPGKDNPVPSEIVVALKELKPLHDYQFTTGLEIKNMFDELCSVYKIPDIDLFINPKDFPILKKDLTEPFNHIFNTDNKKMDNVYSNEDRPYYPILSFNSNEHSADIPIPTNQEWQTITKKIYPSRCDTFFNKNIQN